MSGTGMKRRGAEIDRAHPLDGTAANELEATRYFRSIGAIVSSSLCILRVSAFSPFPCGIQHSQRIENPASRGR